MKINSPFSESGSDWSAKGVVRYADSPEPRLKKQARICIPVIPGVGGLLIMAVVDTAAPWCIFRPGIGSFIPENFELLSDRDESVKLSTRLGLIYGALYHGSITIPADHGESLSLEATVFLSPDWRGDNFLGYQGLLQKLRFAVDPRRNLFYFGDL